MSRLFKIRLTPGTGIGKREPRRALLLLSMNALTVTDRVSRRPEPEHHPLRLEQDFAFSSSASRSSSSSSLTVAAMRVPQICSRIPSGRSRRESTNGERYLDDGRLEISNNAQRAGRP
jgi:hypothetical protein